MLLNRGFTLIEQMVVVIMLGILFTIALPAYAHMIQRWRVTTATDELAGLLRYARAQAAVNLQPVSICPSDNGQRCVDDWRQGQLVFTDPQRLGKPGDDSELLQYQPGHKKLTDLHWRSFPKHNYLTYLPTGETFAQNGTFSVRQVDYEQLVIVYKTGRIRMA